MLIKYFPSSGLTTRDNGILDWIDAHGACHPNNGEIDLAGNPGFTLHVGDHEILDSTKQNALPPNS